MADLLFSSNFHISYFFFFSHLDFACTMLNRSDKASLSYSWLEQKSSQCFLIVISSFLLHYVWCEFSRVGKVAPIRLREILVDEENSKRIRLRVWKEREAGSKFTKNQFTHMMNLLESTVHILALCFFLIYVCINIKTASKKHLYDNNSCLETIFKRLCNLHI